MKIIRTKKFVKNYSNLRHNEQSRVEEAILKFVNDPYHPILRNHALKGKMEGKRAIHAGGDLRIIFQEKENRIIVLMLAVGSHNQVYK
jgi:addiction module RelE/StbE family toxin